MAVCAATVCLVLLVPRSCGSRRALFVCIVCALSPTECVHSTTDASNLIGDQSRLKDWLERTLQPIFDGEPSVLADYILALLNNDQDEEDAIASCNEQLEVFLKNSTAEFVDSLFDAMRRREFHDDSNEGGRLATGECR